MSYGLSLLGEGGHVQIDNVRSSFSVKSKHVLSSSVSYATLQSLYSASAREDLFICPQAGTGKIGFSNSSTIKCTSGSIMCAVIVPSNSLPLSSATFGLRSYDSVGGLIYDSSHSPPRPMGVISTSFYFNGNLNDLYAPVTLTMPSPIEPRKRYANFSFLSRVHGRGWNNGNGENVYSRITWNSQSSITFGTELVFDGQSYNYLLTRSADMHGFVMEIL